MNRSVTGRMFRADRKDRAALRGCWLCALSGMLLLGAGGCGPVDVTETLRQADSAARHGDWQTTETLTRRVLRVADDNIEALVLRGIALYRTGRIDEAERVLARAAALAPNDYDAQLFYGWLLCEIGRYGEALEPLEKAWSIRPGDRNLMTLLGRVCLEQNLARGLRYLQALQRFREFRKSPELYNDLGVLWLQHGDIQEGLRNLNKALVLAPRTPVVLQNLAVAWDNWGRNPEAALRYYRYCLAVCQQTGDRARAVRIEARLRTLITLRAAEKRTRAGGEARTEN